MSQERCVTYRAPEVLLSLGVISTLESEIDRLRPGGQTYFFPALLAAKRQIERTNVARRHIILLSDGETRGSQGDLIDLVSLMKNEIAGILKGGLTEQ